MGIFYEMSGFDLIPEDTNFESACVYYRTLRRLGAARRLEMGAEMSSNVRAIIETGVRHRHPGYDNEQIRLSVLRLLVGEELFRECNPGIDIKP